MDEVIATYRGKVAVSGYHDNFQRRISELHTGRKLGSRGREWCAPC